MQGGRKILVFFSLITFVVSFSLTWGLSKAWYRQAAFSSPTPISVSPIPPPSPIPKPVTLAIPSLDIKTTIQAVGQDDEGRMGVPNNYNDVSWYQLGVKPGEMGSAVIAGHLDSPTGPAVFYQLDQLKLGDIVTTVDEYGQSHTFEVIDRQVYSDATFPIPLVFEQGDMQRLNLITCDGVFNGDSKNYSHRLVVFTQLKQ